MLWRHPQFHCDFINDVIMTSHIYEMTSWRKPSPCHILNETTMKFFTEFHLGHVKAPDHVVQCDTLCRWFIINELSIFERTVNNWEMEAFQFTWMTCLFIVFIWNIWSTTRKKTNSNLLVYLYLSVNNF